MSQQTAYSHTPRLCKLQLSTIYKDGASGRYVLQGYKLGVPEKQNLRIPEGEDAIILPAEFLEEFIRKQQG